MHQSNEKKVEIKMKLKRNKELGVLKREKKKGCQQWKQRHWLQPWGPQRTFTKANTADNCSSCCSFRNGTNADDCDSSVSLDGGFYVPSVA
jgi:hypothetical protein